MDTNFDTLKQLFEKLKTVGIFGRLFQWAAIKTLLIDASADLQKLISNAEYQKEAVAKFQTEKSSLEKDVQMAREALVKEESERDRLSTKLQEASGKIEKFTADNSSLQTQVRSFEEQVAVMTTDLKVAAERNAAITTDNKRLSELSAANEETISNLSRRKAELDVEMATLKTDYANLENGYQEAMAKIEQLTGLHSTSVAMVKANEDRIHLLSAENSALSEKNLHLVSANKKLGEEAATHTETIAGLNKRKHELELEGGEVKNRYQSLCETHSEVKKQNTQLLHDEESRKQDHAKSTATLSDIQARILLERSKEVEDRNNAEIERIRRLKETWNRHQDLVRNSVRMICQKHIIEYVDRVPFKGDPDNTLSICDEFVIFDAKSPGGDDLSNFPGYIKDQAEKAKKYAKQENVKTDIFFVVPANTLDCLTVFVHRFSDHNVYVISIDALEPLILNLRKIEEYEFVDQLSPEDRENICRVLGQFAHLSKRRIQVDSFFARQFIELAYKCENSLPADVLKTAMEFEKAGKLNPPLEKRAKTIPIAEIEQESKLIKREAVGRGIIIQDEIISELFNDVPLHQQTGQ